ncbi:MAG: hypothetical protein IPF92_00005 [Myxococcales bacterium]|nr:hypothetical protein [Myxococcales bacterium]
MPFRLNGARRALDQKIGGLGTCHTPGGLWGAATRSLPSDRRAPHRGDPREPLKGDPTGDCVIRKLMSADMGPYIGGNQRLIYAFKVPQTP